MTEQKNKLYIFCGLPFSGKTTLSKQIVNKLGYTRIDLDEIKFKIFGNSITDDEIDKDGWYKIFAEMYKQIENSLAQGKTVIHDTGNFTKHERGLVQNIANKLGIESLTVFVDTPAKVAKQRLEENRKNPTRFDVTDQDFESTVAEMESPEGNENHIIFDNSIPVEQWIETNFPAQI